MVGLPSRARSPLVSVKGLSQGSALASLTRGLVVLRLHLRLPRPCTASGGKHVPCGSPCRGFRAWVRAVTWLRRGVAQGDVGAWRWKGVRSVAPWVTANGRLFCDSVDRLLNPANRAHMGLEEQLRELLDKLDLTCAMKSSGSRSKRAKLLKKEIALVRSKLSQQQSQPPPAESGTGGFEEEGAPLGPEPGQEGKQLGLPASSPAQGHLTPPHATRLRCPPSCCRCCALALRWSECQAEQDCPSQLGPEKLSEKLGLGLTQLLRGGRGGGRAQVWRHCCRVVCEEGAPVNGHE